jgi:ABC-2 type transport system ATP-binding protein
MAGRGAYKHLLCLAQTNGIPHRRADEVIGPGGPTDVGGKGPRGFSLGMSQRLAPPRLCWGTRRS